jgi:hypothetical protein
VVSKLAAGPPNLPEAGRRLRHFWKAVWSWDSMVGGVAAAPAALVATPDWDPELSDCEPVPDPDLSDRRPNKPVP